MTDVAKFPTFTFTGGNDRAVPEDRQRLQALDRGLRAFSGQVSQHGGRFASYLAAVAPSGTEEAKLREIEGKFARAAAEAASALDIAAAKFRVMAAVAQAVETAIDERHAQARPRR